MLTRCGRGLRSSTGAGASGLAARYLSTHGARAGGIAERPIGQVSTTPMSSIAHEFSVRELMSARVHMGHRASLWNPRMAPYILGERNGMHVIDLDKTVPLLRRALVAVTQIAASGGTFLWLGPRNVQKNRVVIRQAKQAGAFTIAGRWIGGTLTNPIESGQGAKFGYRLPDCLFVVDCLRHTPALREAAKLEIPTIGIIDSDCDPNAVTYPIPGNDDGAHAVYLYCHLMKRAILAGRSKRSNLAGIQEPQTGNGSGLVTPSNADIGAIRGRGFGSEILQ